MADDPTPSVTPNSQTIDPPAGDPPASPPAADPPAADPPAADPPADPEGSVLGGDRAADPADPPAGDPPPAEGPPEKYELALKDADGNDITLDAEAIEAAEPVFRELNLTNEQANRLMPVAQDFANRTAEATLAKIVEAGANQKKEWLDAFKADPEIGGAKREETEHLAAKALDALGYPKDSDFRKVLTETGFGNHPEMIRVFRKIGEMVGEDGFVRADTTNPDKTDRLAALYPEDVPK